ncbi:MAG: HEAT repeat domain-containing protein [Planctomycetota bacterium]|jgi:HEAT repeat protein
MSAKNFKKASIAAGAAVIAQTAQTTQAQGVDELLAGIKSDNPEKRTKSWQSAGQIGAPAVKPLAEVMTDDDLEVARAAKRAIWQIVRYTGRPKANKERRAVEKELVGLLGRKQPAAVRREVLWMLSEIGGRVSIKPIAGLMRNKNLREDARMALERIPSKRALATLKAAFEKAPEDFKPNIAQSLRKRGEEVAGYPCQKLVPTKKTDVKAL